MGELLHSVNAEHRFFKPTSDSVSYNMSMTPRFSGAEIPTNELRAELIALSEAGDKEATELLREIASRPEPTAGDLVAFYMERVGSSTLETSLAGLALLSFGLVFGIMALTMGGLVAADLENFVILVLAFFMGQSCLSTYSSMATAKHFAREFQKLAGMQKMTNLVRQQYRPATPSVSYAYSA